MDFLDALSPLLAGKVRPLLSFVGSGGKTSLVFSVAESAVARGLSVLVTTTTRIWDPSQEGRRVDRTFQPEGRAGRGASDGGGGGTRRAGLEVCCAGFLDVPPASAAGPSRKLLGLAPWLPMTLREDYDLVLVEADGSRGLPIKAPAAHEPVIAASSDLVVGVVGLDALGMPATEGVVHRLDAFLALTGLKRGERIGEEAIVDLARAPEGLFKGLPQGALRVVALSKADLAGRERTRSLCAAIAAAKCADAVLAVSRGDVVYSAFQG